MMTLLFFFYFIVGVQIVFKPNRFIKLQFLFCLFLTMMLFNVHSHLVRI
ncbi:DUF5993 family protein [Legionella hackeliae]|uniref:Uncharacterized protein n=1 Tax=Legionella hackeliae TaxID=449 RepID=A0A0A8UR91_LEGHA|nr:protein of unknown function [Legionella hackeliae]STX49492.1 Uncharacterised protein [Legionella hackeliae]